MELVTQKDELLKEKRKKNEEKARILVESFLTFAVA